MISNRGFRIFALAGATLLAAGVLMLAGCTSIGGAISGAMGKPAATSPAPAQQSEPAPAPAQQDQSAQAQSPAPSSGGAAIAYQYQFSAFYSGFWSMGWFGYKDGNYKPGQGTIWKFTNTGRSSQPLTFERALLKVNADSSQWWRFRLDTGKKPIMYEFLVAPDSTVTKVRYKDSDSGAVGEFVPSQGNQMPSAAPANMPKSKADMAKYKVDQQTITVQAGSFATDHYLYTDDSAQGSAESWVSDTVPGYMVKSVYTNKKNNQTATGELIQIESGVTTALGSY
ncbi:MAG: hypothetical protein ABSG21_03330 [Spirochaetia bacterium]